MTNIVLLVGNLGADPELRSTNGGTDIAIFNLGTSRPKRDSEGKTYKDASGFTAKDTEWHRITCFNGLGRVDRAARRQGHAGLGEGPHPLQQVDGPRGRRALRLRDHRRRRPVPQPAAAGRRRRDEQRELDDDVPF